MNLNRLLRAIERDWVDWVPKEESDGDSSLSLDDFGSGSPKQQFARAVKEKRRLEKRRGRARKRIGALYRRMWRSMPQFDLDVTLSAEDLVEVRASAKLMHEQGLFRLPYPQIYIEAGIGDEGIDSSDARNSTLSLVAEYEDDAIGIGAFKGDGSLRYIEIGHSQLQNGNVIFKSGREGAGMSWQVPAQIVMAAVVLMHTKGVRVDPVGHVGHLRARERPENARHRVWIAGVQAPESSAGPVHERHRPRMHLRRGHLRSQRYGRKLGRTRQIWIEPTIVGHVSDGVIEHDYAVTGSHG